LSYAGRLGILWILVALVLCAAYRRWGVFALTVIAVALADWSATALKALIDRPRPPLRYAEPKTLVPMPHDASFPSGHAATSFACAGTLAPFVSRRGQIVLYVLAAGIAYSRVYVGVHYPLDVVAGAAIGYGVARALRRLPAALRRSRRSPRAD
jgi:undecaprenyl-diphosphatase